MLYDIYVIYINNIIHIIFYLFICSKVDTVKKITEMYAFFLNYVTKFAMYKRTKTRMHFNTYSNCVMNNYIRYNTPTI